jgi:aspartate/methionine/tyrosine aminotransferase
VADEPQGGWRALVGVSAPPQHWQRTWGYFLADGGCELLLARHRELASARAAFLGALGGADHAEGPNLLLAVRGNEQAAVARLAAAGVAVSPGSAFDAPFPAIRVCLTGISPADAAAAGAAVSRLVSLAR